MMIEDRCDGSSNGFLKGSSSTSGGEGDCSLKLRTYKRRKYGVCSSSCKLVDLEKDSCQPSTQMVKELVDIGVQNNSCEQVCDQKINCHSLLNGSDNCSYQHWKHVLENMCQSLSPEDGDGGIHGCIRDALNIPHPNEAKEISEHHDGQSHLQNLGMLNVSSSAVKGLSALDSNGSSGESGHPTISRMCERVFFRVIMSGRFSSLCKLLSENFKGLKIEKLLDFNLINTRLKEGAYECSPMLFSSDILQVWKRLHSIGSEMVSLANNLSELSRDICRDMGEAAELDTSSDGKRELSAQDSDVRSKWEEPSTSVFSTCRQCGETSAGRDCLVCDSCEEMFHVSCIQPAVKEIPHKSWYCANCTSSGLESLHEDCAVCERFNANLGMSGTDTVPTYDEALDELEESSDGIIETGVQVFKGSKRLPCKVCGCMFSNGEEFRVCEHRFCQYKYYHTRCLTNKQLKSYGPRWYCPSCLCRVCLTDKDDDDLVMCDGCDHGYHIYCMNPPRTSIPKGKWFCSKCDAGIQAIRQAKKLYEGFERKEIRSQGKRVTDGSSKNISDFEEAVGGSGGMDMLLTAAKTLNEEELDLLNGIQ